MNIPRSRSPLSILSASILASAQNIAPEKQHLLHPSAPKFRLRFSDDPHFDIRVNTVTHVATLPIACLEYLWASAHLLWVLYQEYIAAQRSGQSQLDLRSVQRVSEAIELANWARDNQAGSGLGVWPSGLPRPTRTRPTEAERVANELFLAAIAWLIHHEIAHVRAGHRQFKKVYPIQQEVEADRLATEWIFDACTDAAMLIKRQIGMVVALVAMQFLDEPTGGETYIGSHPPTVERIHSCLDLAQAGDDSQAVALAAVAMQFHLSQFDLRIALDGTSCRDILSDALVRFRAGERMADPSSNGWQTSA